MAKANANSCRKVQRTVFQALYSHSGNAASEIGSPISLRMVAALSTEGQDIDLQFLQDALGVTALAKGSRAFPAKFSQQPSFSARRHRGKRENRASWRGD